MNPKQQIKLIVPSVAIIVAISLGLNLFGSNEIEEHASIDSTLLNLKSAENETYSQPSTNLTSIDNSNKMVASVDQRLSLIANRNDLSAYDEAILLAAINEPLVWDFATEASTESLPLDEIEKEDGRTFFQANPARIAVSIPGDILEISLPELDQAINLEVVQVNIPNEGIISLSGEVQGTSGSFNITQSNGIIAGHINTATNSYSFEIFGDTGWIHESGALFTGELEPVIHADNEEHSTFGDSGEHIIADGSSNTETLSNNEQTETQE